MAGRNYDSGRQAVIWLATTIVLVLGAAGTGFVVMVATENREIPLMIWAGCFSLIIFVLVVFNIRWEEPMNQLKFWLSYHERNDPTDDYRAARRSIDRREKFGTNEPPSIDSVRDAANHGGAWVPRSSAKGRSKKS